MNKVIPVAVLAVIVITAGFYAYTTFGSGTLRIKITDPPKDWGAASAIYIEYDEVKVHKSQEGNESGWYTVVESGGWINLKEVLNTTKTLGSGALQAGTYNLIRFEVTECLVTISGTNYTATVESGKLNIAILGGGITIQSGSTSTVIIDITPKVVGSPAQGLKVVPAAKASLES